MFSGNKYWLVWPSEPMPEKYFTAFRRPGYKDEMPSFHTKLPNISIYGFAMVCQMMGLP